MKKTISIMLALVLVLALSVTAFAADITNVTDGNTASQTVTATYVPGTVGATATVYSVTISWEGSSTITYSAADGGYVWDPQSLTYSGEVKEAGWSGEAQYTITVANRSNAAVNAAASWNATNNITSTYTDSGSITVASAAPAIPTKGAQGTEQKDTITASISNVSGPAISENTAVGTITVTITAG